MSRPPVISYATLPPPRNTAAMVSLAAGLMLFVPVIGGIVAIACGRRGLRAAQEFAAGRVGMARTGIVLGVINIVAWSVLLAVLGIQARRNALQARCYANLRAIGQAMLLYSNDNRGQMPPTLEHLVASGYFPAGSQTFTCPERGGDASVPPATVGPVVTSSYALGPPLNPNPKHYRFIGDMKGEFVLAWEPTVNHDRRGINVLFASGGVKWFERATAMRIVVELSSGLNPPPTIAPKYARLMTLPTTLPWEKPTTAPATFGP